MDLRGTHVLVMGLGVHGGGLGVARWLLAQGAVVTVTDTAQPAALATSTRLLDEAAAALGATVRYTLGEHRPADFTNCAMVVVNPAVRPDSPWLALATANGALIETEMTLFFRVCPGLILGVTGTKGKTTSTLLLAAMIRERFPNTVAAGNLRVSALEALPQITPETPVVLELSSFQLERLGRAGLSPQYALITNLSADHLNWHGGMAEYAAAKWQIAAHQGADGVAVLPYELAGAAEGIWTPAPHAGRRLTFSAEHPAADATIRDGALYLHDEVLLHSADVRLPGAHNRANALGAATLARSFGVEPDAIRAAVRSFTGVEHRLELVRDVDGVRYVNDTTATNPAAALAALAAIDTPLVLIAGGADKELDFSALGSAIRRRVKALVLLEGTATARLCEAMLSSQSSNLTVEHASSASRASDITSRSAGINPMILGPYSDFATAIAAARAAAEPGDTVLLSPGCASFGMFRNEFHRGEEFRRIVQAL
jgi:UDP-N-acetylmuramoylalanine--D-glutamate ligase